MRSIADKNAMKVSVCKFDKRKRTNFYLAPPRKNDFYSAIFYQYITHICVNLN